MGYLRKVGTHELEASELRSLSKPLFWFLPILFQFEDWELLYTLSTGPFSCLHITELYVLIYILGPNSGICKKLQIYLNNEHIFQFNMVYFSLSGKKATFPNENDLLKRENFICFNYFFKQDWASYHKPMI